MKWSYKIGEFLGIGVYMHATFPLLLAFAALPALVQEGNLFAAFENVAFILVLFVCVVLHEYGHALSARRYGIRTRDITLLPIGGIARLERMPDKPRQEFVVAAAGPLVNVAIAALLFAALSWGGGRMPTLFGQDSFLERLMVLNIGLVLFNLIPAFPMDGGRLVRAVLAARMDYARATRIAAMLGQGLAVVFGIVGIFVNPLLVMTALFIWFGAAGEAELATSRATLRGAAVGEAMRTNVRALSPYEWLAFALDTMRATAQQDFPVVENGRVVGVLTRDGLIEGLRRFGAYAPVAYVMRRDVGTLEVDDPLDQASEILQDGEITAVPVTRNGMLVGMLTPESIRDFIRIRKLFGTRPRPASPLPLV